MIISYIYAKVLKKLRGSAIRNGKIPKTSKIESGSHVINTEFGRYSFCGYDCSIYNATIGAFCSIASRVTIGGGTHPLQWVSTSPAFYYGRDSIPKNLARNKYDSASAPVQIGNDVWIGEGAYIKAGVTIGDGAVVGMGSVVTKDVEPYSIVAGCPAQEIRKRFDEQTISNLLEMKWWNFSEEALAEYSCYFPNVEQFIHKVGKK